MDENLFKRYLDRRRSLGAFAPLAPYRWQNLSSALPIGWAAYSQFLSEHADELANAINELRQHLGTLMAWRDVIPTLSEDEQHRAVIDYVTPIGTLALLLPYVIRSRFIYSIAHLSHQANKLKLSEWKDDLPLDKELYSKHADQYGKHWPSYKKLKAAMERIADKRFTSATHDFRNKYNHRYSPRIELGVTGLVTRTVDENGKVSYGFGATSPLKLQDIVPLLIQQHEKCLKAFERYQELVHEQSDAINLELEQEGFGPATASFSIRSNAIDEPDAENTTAEENAISIWGIDFTSTPSRRKPITCLTCTLSGTYLNAGELHEWQDFEAFEAALNQPGPWIAGIDFPFGQARRFIETIGWPDSWSGYVDFVAAMTRDEYRNTLDAYRQARPTGDKEHRRMSDVLAKSISPQKLYGTPVGLMFYEGAPRLKKACVSIPGLQVGDPDRIVVEAYPGVLARHLIGKRSYKQDTKAKQTDDQRAARIDILAAIKNGALRATHGIAVEAPDSLIDDPGADHLDALLCAIQAAWAWTQRDAHFGTPDQHDPLEGWIADPTVWKQAEKLPDDP